MDTFIAQVALDNRTLASRFLAWELDALRVRLGLAVLVDFPEVPLRRGAKMPEPDETARLMVRNGQAYLVKDVK